MNPDIVKASTGKDSDSRASKFFIANIATRTPASIKIVLGTDFFNTSGIKFPFISLSFGSKASKSDGNPITNISNKNKFFGENG